jgi:hypothetical protein
MTDEERAAFSERSDRIAAAFRELLNGITPTVEALRRVLEASGLVVLQAGEEGKHRPMTTDEPVGDAQGLYTTRDAYTMLHIDRTTLKHWLAAAGMRSVDDPADKRVSGYTHKQIAHLANVHHVMLGEAQKEPKSRRMLRLEHEVDVLQQEVAELKATVARLQGSRASEEQEAE